MDFKSLNDDLSGKADISHTHAWNNITSKPTTFPPSTHTHDGTYYTKTEVKSILGKLLTGSSIYIQGVSKSSANVTVPANGGASVNIVFTVPSGYYSTLQ